MKKFVLVKDETITPKDASGYCPIYWLDVNGHPYAKVVRMDTGRYVFSDMETTNCWMNGEHDTLEALINYTVDYNQGNVVQFSNLTEFFNYIKSLK